MRSRREEQGAGRQVEVESANQLSVSPSWIRKDCKGGVLVDGRVEGHGRGAWRKGHTHDHETCMTGMLSSGEKRGLEVPQYLGGGERSHHQDRVGRWKGWRTVTVLVRNCRGDAGPCCEDCVEFRKGKWGLIPSLHDGWRLLLVSLDYDCVTFCSQSNFSL